MIISCKTHVTPRGSTSISLKETERERDRERLEWRRPLFCCVMISTNAHLPLYKWANNNNKKCDNDLILQSNKKRIINARASTKAIEAILEETWCWW